MSLKLSFYNHGHWFFILQLHLHWVLSQVPRDGVSFFHYFCNVSRVSHACTSLLKKCLYFLFNKLGKEREREKYEALFFYFAAFWNVWKHFTAGKYVSDAIFKFLKWFIGFINWPVKLVFSWDQILICSGVWRKKNISFNSVCFTRV